MKRIKAKGIEVVVFEPKLNENEFFNSRVEKELTFKRGMDIIPQLPVAELEDVAAKVFTRDLFGALALKILDKERHLSLARRASLATI